MLRDLKMIARYFGGLRQFLRDPLSAEEGRLRIEQQLHDRAETFLRILERGVFGNPDSPYRDLFRHAGLAFDDVAELVRRDGVEQALSQLYDAGVYVTHDELKGRREIRRGSLTIQVRSEDLQNPLLVRAYVGQSGGSRSAGTRIAVDLELVTHEAAYLSLYCTAFGLEDRPLAVWRAIPPGVAGMKGVLRSAKLGRPPERWFSQNRPELSRKLFRYWVFTNYAVYGSRLLGRPLPVPEHVPLSQASKVARWLADKRSAGTPAWVDLPCSSFVRVCHAAMEHGLDIRGTVFCVGGEPHTPARDRVAGKTGTRATNRYSMAEVGNIGMPCAAPSEVDEVHVLTDKLAVLQRETPVGTGGRTVGELFLTTLLPACPNLMINVASGDYGVLQERDCGCLLQEIGLRTRLHTIRSYDKLTSEGMTFHGDDVLRLVEEILPGRFGGTPTHYQFVEEEENGLARVSLRVSPGIGEVNEEQVVATILQVLGSPAGAKRMAADIWKSGDTLRVVRAEPHMTGAAKILPLHVMRSTEP